MVRRNFTVQNRFNKNKEETNKFVEHSYYYPVDRKTVKIQQPEKGEFHFIPKTVHRIEKNNYYDNESQHLIEADELKNQKNNLK